ncbi:MAG: SHOCT domain-containing protein [Acidocella sp.]|nr:SHOCT domain-containing protein [Acidocella sp.]
MRKQILATLALTLGAHAALAQPVTGNGWGYSPYGMMGGSGGMGFMLLFGGLFWLLLLALVFAALLHMGRGCTRSRPNMPPLLPRPPRGLETLDERYARGEVNREEYLQKKQDILDGRG